MRGPVLTTERLRLEPLSEEHAEAFGAVLKDRQTMSFYPVPFDDTAVAAWMERSNGFWRDMDYGRYAVVRREDDRLMGDAGLMHLEVNSQMVHDIGWVLHRDFWHGGYATEAARAIRDDGFRRLQLPEIHAGMPIDHPASRKVAERIGMTEIDRFRNPRNRGIETHFFRLTKREWRVLPDHTGSQQD